MRSKERVRCRSRVKELNRLGGAKIAAERVRTSFTLYDRCGSFFWICGFVFCCVTATAQTLSVSLRACSVSGRSSSSRFQRDFPGVPARASPLAPPLAH